jgi:beta-amylase
MEHGWRYLGIGEFQCYDRYSMKSLRNAAKQRGHLFWGRGPDNTGTYNSRPQDTGFFCDAGDYDGYYGRFFLSWYSKLLTDHADHVLMLAKLAFEGSSIAAKVLL